MSIVGKGLEMTGQLMYDATMTRLGELQRQAEGRRIGQSSTVAEGARRATARRDLPAEGAPAPIAIRRATAADRAAIARLAVLDSATAPKGELLLAEVGGELQAAIEIASGTTIADPFRPTVQVVELLSLRAARLRSPAGVTRRLRLRLRSAYRAA